MEETKKDDSSIWLLILLISASVLYLKGKAKKDDKSVGGEVSVGGGSASNGGGSTGGGGGRTPLPQQPQIIGVLEDVQNGKISGYALDLASDLGKPLEVDIYVDGTKVATKKANLFREDVSQMLINEYGLTPFNNEFGFEYNGAIPYGKHTIRVTAKGTDIDIVNSPMDVTFVKELEIPTGGGEVSNDCQGFYCPQEIHDDMGDTSSGLGVLQGGFVN